MKAHLPHCAAASCAVELGGTATFRLLRSLAARLAACARSAPFVCRCPLACSPLPAPRRSLACLPVSSLAVFVPPCGAPCTMICCMPKQLLAAPCETNRSKACQRGGMKRCSCCCRDVGK